MAQATFSCPFGPIHLESTPLRFRLAAKTAFVPLLLLFPANPLRWASPGATRDWAKRPGDAADGLRLRYAPPRSIGPLSPDPFYEGRSPVLWYLISGAQNLSDVLNSRRATGPWVCEKLGQARFHNRACLCRANAPNANLAGGPRASPTRNGRAFLTSVGEGLAPPAKPSPLGEGGWPKARRMRGTVPVIKAARLSRRGGPCGRPRAAGVVGPYGLPYFVGAAHWAARNRSRI